MAALVHEKVWVDKKLYDDAERQFYESQAKLRYSGSQCPSIPYIVVPNENHSPRGDAVSVKKYKQKNMPPVQSVGNVANAPPSPKKSKKNKKDKAKNRTTSEKERENKSSSEREKEVSVEKSLEPVATEKVAPSQRSPPRDLCPAKLAKNKDNTDKKSNKNEKSAGAEVASINKIGKETVASKVTDKKGGVSQPSGQCSLASEVAKARQHIKNSLECMDSVAALAGVPNVDLINKVNSLERENKDLKKAVIELRNVMHDMKINFETFTSNFTGAAAPFSAPVSKAAACTGTGAGTGTGAAASQPKEDSDDGVDLFGSDDEEESAEASRVREERLAAYNAKKSKKPVLIAKSNIILDVKPWDDETDMSAMEAAVRGVSADGLLWGAAKLVPLAYGIHKLQISCVVEDDKVSIDWLQEELEKIEDYVQSVDIAAFNKV